MIPKPSAEPGEPNEEASVAAANSAESGPCILVVDDVESNRDLVAASLFQLSAQFSFARNGLEALALVERQRFNLIFTDLQMPGMDGIKAVTLIRQLPQGRDVPIVAITGNHVDEERQRCMNAGFDDVVFKPINRKQLMATATKWLQTAGQPRANTPPD
jgi:CheY-like chemotaxis protein